MKYAVYDKQENITALGETIDEVLNELRYLGVIVTGKQIGRAHV